MKYQHSRLVLIFSGIGLAFILTMRYFFLAPNLNLDGEKGVFQFFVILTFTSVITLTLFFSSIYLDRVAASFIERNWIYALFSGILVALFSLLITSIFASIVASGLYIAEDIYKDGISVISWKSSTKPMIGIPFWVMLFGFGPCCVMGAIYGLLRHQSLSSNNRMQSDAAEPRR